VPDYVVAVEPPAWAIMVPGSTHRFPPAGYRKARLVCAHVAAYLGYDTDLEVCEGLPVLAFGSAI